MDSASAIIVGGGIGGMTTALALARTGWRVRLYERAPAFSEIGAGIMLTPNATRVLQHLGLAAALEECAMRPPASIYRRFDDAEIVGDSPLGATIEAKYGSPYFHIHRSDLLDVLTAAVESQGRVELFTDHEAVGCSQENGRVTVEFAGGETAADGLVIGCDGVHSTLRSSLAPHAEPRFRGQVAWRGLVPAAGLPASVTARESVVWIGPDRHIVQYVLRGGSLVNFVAIAAKDEWTEEGWNTPSTVEEVTAEFTGWHEDVQSLLAATPAGALYKWGLFDRDPLDQWVYGHVALLGDAAHPLVPFMAQGAAMAIEDALVLSRCLQGHDSLPEALDGYQRARTERTARIVLQSRAQTNLYQRLTGDKNQQRAASIDFVYGFDATTCPRSLEA
jgi:salicylate hydroxylase